jgi:hypothetical protein
MRNFVILVMVALLLSSAALPAYANTRQENNKNIANFVMDTIKLPLLLMGSFATQDHEKVKEDLDYKDHQGLKKSLR